MHFDLLLVGGGLHNSLVAWWLLHHRPEVRFALIERAARLGGNHTWSFHLGDVDAEAAALLGPLVVAQWPGYDVAFPGFARGFELPYATIASAQLDEMLQQRLKASNASLLLGTNVMIVEAKRAVLANGREVTAGMVIDGRGPRNAGARAGEGYQKFVGLEVRLGRPCGPERPLLMDSTVPQLDGFRFMYTLPLARDRLLVEDTYYSVSATLDRPTLRQRALDHAAACGWPVAEIIREEAGVLPIPWRDDGEPTAAAPLRSGYRGGWFHPTTGYSLPMAVRLAKCIVEGPPDQTIERWSALADAHRRQARFCRRLNWLMFRAYPPEERWRLLERFHRILSPEAIGRFYALQLTGGDRRRLLCGRPPRGFSLRQLLKRSDA